MKWEKTQEKKCWELLELDRGYLWRCHYYSWLLILMASLTRSRLTMGFLDWVN